MKCYRYKNSHSKKKGYNRPKEIGCKYLYADGRSMNETKCKTCLSKAGKTKMNQKTQVIKEPIKNNKPIIVLDDYQMISEFNIYKQRSKKLQPIKKDNFGKNSYFSNEFIGFKNKKKNLIQYNEDINYKKFQREITKIKKDDEYYINGEKNINDIFIPNKEFNISNKNIKYLINRNEIRKSKTKLRRINYNKNKINDLKRTKKRNKERFMKLDSLLI